MRSSPVALICGPPGVGKTAVSEAIAIGAQAAHLEEDVLFGMRPGHLRDASSQEIIVEQIVVLCELFKRHHLPVLIEGLFFDPIVVARLNDELGLSSILLLEASLPVCLERNHHRSRSGIQLPDTEVRMLHALIRPANWRRVPAEPPLDAVVSIVRRYLREAGWPA